MEQEEKPSNTHVPSSDVSDALKAICDELRLDWGAPEARFEPAALGVFELLLLGKLSAVLDVAETLAVSSRSNVIRGEHISKALEVLGAPGRVGAGGDRYVAVAATLDTQLPSLPASPVILPQLVLDKGHPVVSDTTPGYKETMTEMLKTLDEYVLSHDPALDQSYSALAPNDPTFGDNTRRTGKTESLKLFSTIQEKEEDEDELLGKDRRGQTALTLARLFHLLSSDEREFLNEMLLNLNLHSMEEIITAASDGAAGGSGRTRKTRSKAQFDEFINGIATVESWDLFSTLLTIFFPVVQAQVTTIVTSEYQTQEEAECDSEALHRLERLYETFIDSETADIVAYVGYILQTLISIVTAHTDIQAPISVTHLVSTHARQSHNDLYFRVYIPLTLRMTTANTISKLLRKTALMFPNLASDTIDVFFAGLTRKVSLQSVKEKERSLRNNTENEKRRGRRSRRRYKASPHSIIGCIYGLRNILDKGGKGMLKKGIRKLCCLNSSNLITLKSPEAEELVKEIVKTYNMIQDKPYETDYTIELIIAESEK